jgi:hypothetical protein
MNLNDVKIHSLVKHTDDPNPGVAIDIYEDMVVVDFRVHGEYGHPGGRIEVDASELEPFMIPGERYLIRFKQWMENGQHREMEFVGTYVDVNRMLNEYVFNQRPAAGTGAVAFEDLISATPTDRESTQVYKP